MSIKSKVWCLFWYPESTTDVIVNRKSTALVVLNVENHARLTLPAAVILPIESIYHLNVFCRHNIQVLNTVTALFKNNLADRAPLTCLLYKFLIMLSISALRASWVIWLFSLCTIKIIDNNKNAINKKQGTDKIRNNEESWQWHFSKQLRNGDTTKFKTLEKTWPGFKHWKILALAISKNNEETRHSQNPKQGRTVR